MSAVLLTAARERTLRDLCVVPDGEPPALGKLSGIGLLHCLPEGAHDVFSGNHAHQLTTGAMTGKLWFLRLTINFGVLASDEFHNPTLLNSASPINLIRSRATCPPHSCKELFHSARANMDHVWLQLYPYLEVASGSIPLFLIASEARTEARNSISRLEP